MMVMICWRVTPCLAVRMAITSVVLGSTAPDAPGACPDCDCAAAATGSAATRNGIMNFIGSPRSVWLVSRVDGSGGSFEMTARTGEASCQSSRGCGAASQTTGDRLEVPGGGAGHIKDRPQATA